MSRQAPGHWHRRGALALCLLPLALLFGIVAGVRRLLYRHRLLRCQTLPVPVVVVGNIAVGGSGKTPVVAWLADALRAAGHRPGIVSRGYGGRVEGVEVIAGDGDPARHGDEPVLLTRLTGCPLAVGRDRPAAGRALLDAHPECDVLISDDGLQHYRLGRTVEVAVVDESVLGNRLLLPAGPLREGLGRLRQVDLVLAHGPLSPALHAALGSTPVYSMTLEGRELRQLGGAGGRIDAAELRGRKVHAFAGIGRPQRFFDHLRALGLDVVGHPFADHHRFSAADFSVAGDAPCLLTSKDAVKCAPFASAEFWELPVTARIDDAAAAHIMEKLRHGRPTA